MSAFADGFSRELRENLRLVRELMAERDRVIDAARKVVEEIHEMRCAGYSYTDNRTSDHFLGGFVEWRLHHGDAVVEWPNLCLLADQLEAVLGEPEPEGANE